MVQVLAYRPLRPRERQEAEAMTDPATPPASYLEEAAAILRAALKSAEERYQLNTSRSTPEERRELLDARIRVAEGFARLHEAERAPQTGHDSDSDAGSTT
jgi:hypothetical protein